MRARPPAGTAGATAPSGRRTGSGRGAGTARGAGLRAWHMRRPCWIRLTWPRSICSGSRSRQEVVVGLVVDRLRRAAARPGARPARRGGRPASSGRPKREQQHDRRGLLADAVDRRSASRAPRARACRRGTRASSRRAPRGSCASAAWIRGAFWVASPPGRMTSISSSSGAILDRAPNPAARRPAGRRRPSPRPGCGARRRRPRRVGRAERLERVPRRSCRRCSG